MRSLLVNAGRMGVHVCRLLECGACVCICVCVERESVCMLMCVCASVRVLACVFVFACVCVFFDNLIRLGTSPHETLL